jgi:hypothetical protein
MTGQHWLGSIEGEFVYVGWLDKGQPYPTGEVEPVALEKLFLLCLTPVVRTRGFHLCPFCSAHGVTSERGGQKLVLGSAEIHVRASGRRVFLSPDMIYHYIVSHHYLPPQEFLAVVRAL